MSRVLVTGATGFIGRRFVPFLTLRGHEVRCLVRRTVATDDLRRSGAELLVGDVRDRGALQRATRGCEFVYHLAGKTSALHRQEMYEVNARGTDLITRACAAQMTPPTMVLVSSLAAVGTSPRGQIQSEVRPARPISEYGRSKQLGERAARAWAARIPLSIVRPAIVFGPGDRELLLVFRAIAQLGVHAVPGYTPRRVALIYCDDLLEILMRVASRGERVPANRHVPENLDDGLGRGIYHATVPEQPFYAELGRMIARAVNSRQTLVLPFAEPFIWLIALGNQLINAAYGRSDSLNVDKIREALAGEWTSSAEPVRRELGFQPPRSLQQRLNETARWYREQGWI